MLVQLRKVPETRDGREAEDLGVFSVSSLVMIGDTIRAAALPYTDETVEFRVVDRIFPATKGLTAGYYPMLDKGCECILLVSG